MQLRWIGAAPPVPGRLPPLYRAQDRPAIGDLPEHPAARPCALGVDEALLERDFLQAGGLNTLAVLERADELARRAPRA